MKTKPRPRGLSKSRLNDFRQCPRRLYLSVHHPELKQESDDSQQNFATGNEVGEIARAFHPEGILIEQQNLSDALRATETLIAGKPRRPLFEATFQHNGLLVRADLLLPAKRGWHLVEVKSSGEVKPYHLEDAAIQTHVLRSSGINVARVAIQHLNTKFVYPGKSCYHQVKRNGEINSLFMQEDVTDKLDELIGEVPKWVSGAQATLAGKMPPPTGNCEKPFPCPFQEYCYPAESQPEYPVTLLPQANGKKIAADLLEQGYDDLRKVPLALLKNETHQRIWNATRTGKHYLGKGAADALSALPYPRYFHDFETINPAVPTWKGTSPYQQVPFQWSCHIQRRTGKLDHKMFLDLSGNDPSRNCAETLIAALGKRGPVFVYNQSFEINRLKELAGRYADLAEELGAIIKRIVDLLPITREHYYHPDMKGSWSIKAVLPTIAPDLDYANLEEVQDGGAAQAAYLEAIHPETTVDRKREREKQLRVYCERDTEAMVRLAQFLTTGKTATTKQT